MITVEVIRNSTEFIAEEMGIVLRNTAYSPNIKDRLDFSCAIVSREGDLVAQAEHIPVHLGSLAVGAKNFVECIEEFEDAIYVTNDPYVAGTHLNDVMLLKPVFYKELICFVVNKAHHVDVGGTTPGSMSMDARDLYAEGLIIPPTKLDDKVMEFIKANVRTSNFVGDLKAQIASLKVGEKRILELIDKFGVETLLDSWREAMDYTERLTKAKIEKLGEFECEGVDYVEYEKPLNINVRVVSKGKIFVDFSGTHKQVKAPLNAVFGVTVASTSFALKAVLDPDLPMNHGFLRAIEIYAPEGTLVNPIKPAPVSAGNVETSQRIVDAIFKALAEIFEIPAASHGSMNNVIIGGEGWAFYETLGGGSGARPNGDGIDGIHVNMTNTMNTPVEVIEREYPIMVLEYSLREDSGGAGKFRGGLGIRRVYKLLSDATLSIIADRVKIAPWGLKGGKEGERGEHYVLRNGNRIELSGKETIELKAGDIVVVNTPGGGGYGDPKERDRSRILEDLEDGKVSEEYVRRWFGEV